MKTFLTLVAGALLACATVAPALAAPPATLTITAQRGQPFSLVLDGRLLTRPVARQVHVDLLAPGHHWAELSLPTPYGPPMRFRTSLWLQPGLETDYVLVMRPYGPQLRQVGVVALGGPGYGPGGYYGNGQGGYYGNSPVPQGGYYDHDDQGSGGYGQRQGDDDNRGYDPRGAAPAQPGNGYPAPAPTYPAYPGGAQGGYPPAPADGGYDPRGAAPAASLQPFAPAEIAGLTQDLRQRATDEERLRLATEALDQSSLRTDELAELMGAFVHDESRIELARFGYSHLNDPQNFSRVESALQFRSSARTLRQAVGLPPQ